MKPTPTEEQRRAGLSFSFEIGDGVLKVLIAVALVFFLLGGRVSCASHDEEPAQPSDPVTQPDEKVVA